MDLVLSGGGVQELGHDGTLHQVGAHTLCFKGFEEGLGVVAVLCLRKFSANTPAEP
jgi:hypothetical protein